MYIYSDGGSRGNPGPAGIGGQAMDGDGHVLAEVCEFLGETTNNVAEYQALIRILEESSRLGFKKISIQTDSELVAFQITGVYKIKSKKLMPLVEKVKSVLEMYEEVKVTAIPREKNTVCDGLANIAIDMGLEGEIEPVFPEYSSGTQDNLF
ncbi:MAG: ribonuclease HI family protein [Actinobacteria bacterium]|nr:ribonuclease HI family protein [Actinomycetota bacterium]